MSLRGMRETRERRRAESEQRKAEAKVKRDREKHARELEMHILTLEGPAERTDRGVGETRRPTMPAARSWNSTANSWR